MEKQNPSIKSDPKNDEANSNLNSQAEIKADSVVNKSTGAPVKPKTESNNKAEKPPVTKKPVKPPKLEDKPFEEFISEHLIPGLKSSIEAKGIRVEDIKFMEGVRPVVGGKCWMVFCQISNQKRFWLCFNKDSITSDKNILLADSNSEPSIVESFLIDEKKTTLPLLISRVLQRLNGQKWIGVN
tara:strand:+ start:353 stop:904 length:552 start_codon:yes stop_codon:yes gene_type:complete